MDCLSTSRQECPAFACNYDISALIAFHIFGVLEIAWNIFSALLKFSTHPRAY